MAQSIYKPIRTESLSELASRPFREREARVLNKIANTEKAVDATGIMDVSISGLAPNMQQVAKPWIDAIKSNMSEGFYSNNVEKVNEARRQAQELKAFVDSGKLATTSANQAMIEGSKRLWMGLSVDEETGKQLYQQKTQSPYNIAFNENGYPLIKTDDGGLASPLSIGDLNPQNYLIFTDAIEWGKNIDPKAWQGNYDNIFATAKNADELGKFVTKQFNEDVKLGRVSPEEIAISYLLKDKTPTDIGQSKIIQEKDIILQDEELFNEAKNYYLNNSIGAANAAWQASQRMAASKAAGSSSEKAPKFTQSTTTITLDDGTAITNTTQYTLTTPIKIGAKTIYNAYKTPDGRWYGFSATTKRQGSKSFVEEEIIELNSSQSDYVVGVLGLKGVKGATNRATRAAGRM